MADLETQVVKIQIGNQKTTRTFIYVLAEEVPQSKAELYFICELPILNPAAIPECEKIAHAVASSFRRSYHQPVHTNSFENALTGINEELGKLSSLGQSHWIGKLNAILAVKHKSTLSIAVAGKVSALLVRDAKPIDMAGESESTHPLKTFENFAVGKLLSEDVLVFSTAELYNYLSLERLHNMLLEMSLPQTAQEVVRILKENAGPEVGFGTIIAVQKNQVIAPVKEPILESYTIPSDLETATNEPTSSFNKAKEVLRLLPQHIFKKPNIGSWFKRESNGTSSWHVKDFFSRNKTKLSSMTTTLATAKDKINTSGFKSWSWTKRFFLISAVILFVAFGVNLIIAKRVKDAPKTDPQIGLTLDAVRAELTDANSALLFNNKIRAKELMLDANTKLSTLTNLTPEQNDQKNQLTSLATDIANRLENKTEANPAPVATLLAADTLIPSPGFLSAKSGDTLLSYNIETGLVTDNALKLSETVHTSKYAQGNTAIIFTGSNLALWNSSTGTAGKPFTQNVPAEQEFGGMAYYPSNGRIYAINRNTNQIITYTTSGADITKATPWSSEGALSAASDLAIDGSLYVYNAGSILIYNSGKLSGTLIPDLSIPLGGTGKIWTDGTTENLYLLDKQNSRILVLTKKGEVLKNLTAKEFTNLKDFWIDEKAKVMYVLNDTILFKIQL